MFKLKKKPLIILAVIVFLLVVILKSTSAIRVPVSDGMSFPFNIFTLIGREVKGVIFYHRNFIQNEILNKEADLLKQKLSSLDEVSAENKRLKNLLSLKQNSTYKVIASKVIARSADNWSSTLIINKGSDSGIRPGMPVISYLGLVGKILETTKFTSKVLLISDPNMGVSGVIQRSRQEGLVCGTLGSNLIMKYIPEESDININDTVVTSGLSQTYPKSLLIGTVVDAGKEFSGLSSYAIIKPVVNLSSIEEVLIIVE
ncbi:MAG: rod shape-determining protein MreC [Candidatus Omnitrophica bacterium]|nr:rod shape-determining protein MreC [Candidatus Omnitrophota bacterium]